MIKTGKVEYAPGYKSKSQVKPIAAQRGQPYPDMSDKFKGMEVRAEWQRLKDAVVEAAIARRKAKLAEPNGGIRLLHATLVAEHEAVDALIAFEAEHKMK